MTAQRAGRQGGASRGETWRWAVAPWNAEAGGGAQRAKHVLGPAIYQAQAGAGRRRQAQACELAPGDAPNVGDSGIRWAIEHASPVVREVVRRMPVGQPGRSRPGALLHELDAALRR